MLSQLSVLYISLQHLHTHTLRRDVGRSYRESDQTSCETCGRTQTELISLLTRAPEVKGRMWNVFSVWMWHTHLLIQQVLLLKDTYMRNTTTKRHCCVRVQISNEMWARRCETTVRFFHIVWHHWLCVQYEITRWWTGPSEHQRVSWDTRRLDLKVLIFTKIRRHWALDECFTFNIFARLSWISMPNSHNSDYRLNPPQADVTFQLVGFVFSSKCVSLCITARVASVQRSIKPFVFTANGPAITHTHLNTACEYDVELRNPTDAKES